MSCCILRSKFLTSSLCRPIFKNNSSSFCCVKNVFIRSGVNRYYSTEPRRKAVIFGIETSCDDTGCAIVNESGKILGEGLHSQQLIHLRNGGIIPPLAQDLHRSNIEKIATEVFEEAGMDWSDIDAVAVTVKPGLSLSLSIGLKYAKHLCRKYNKPIIPIHHMEAHALTARMEHEVEYPFLVLLISGGHCLLALVNDVDDFRLIGTSIDDSPGEAFDKTARRMKLRNMEQFSKLSGGPAIELASKLSKNPDSFDFSVPMSTYRDCDFSFAGMKNKVIRHLMAKEREHGIVGDETIPEVFDLCASFQLAVTRHLCHRTQRAMEYLNVRELLPEDKRTLVVSGGVACNDYIAKGLGLVCEEMGYRLIRPRPKLCTDNGVMIAWNGVERAMKNIGLTNDLNSVNIQPRCRLGTDISEDLKQMRIKCKWVKLGKLLEQNA